MKSPSSPLSSQKAEPIVSWELELFEPPPDTLYSIEAASLISDVPRRQIAVFCKYNLLSPAIPNNEHGFYFSGAAIRLIRRIEALRSICGNDFAGIGIILELSAALESLRSEIAAMKRNNEYLYEKK